MTRPRSPLISLESTPYYHCIARCVLRAWLCGDDSLTDKSFDHRRQGIMDRLQIQAAIFCPNGPELDGGAAWTEGGLLQGGVGRAKY